MCGLDVIVNLETDIPTSLDELDLVNVIEGSDTRERQRRAFIRRRGPDVSDSLEFRGPTFHLDMFSGVLQIQGDSVCQQPLKSGSSGSILLWNGEFLNHSFSSESDTRIVLEALDRCSSVPECLDSIEGPFAFVFYDNPSHRLWFGKDKTGRRSLLVNVSQNKRQMIISSSALAGGTEIPAGKGIFCLDLSDGSLTLHAWPTLGGVQSPSFLSGVSTPDLNELHSRFRKGIERHMQSISRPSNLGILFSGGLDSAILASVAAEMFSSCSHQLLAIDLINVACVGITVSPDRGTGLVTFSDLLTRYPDVPFRFICVDISPDELKNFEYHILQLCAPNDTLMDFNISVALWFGGRGQGLVLQPSFVEDPEWPELKSAIVQNESTESAAENRRPKKCPLSSQTGVMELGCVLCTKRKAKPGCVQTACRICCKLSECPAHTPWDSKKNGKTSPNLNEFVNKYLDSKSVVSDCRILLVGHGADELFGGYGRHETKNSTGGPEALRKELLLDLRRLWKRNLGRDDRILADHGRDVRHPFLDESVIEFVGELNVSALASVEGENKPILRALARERLGMDSAANFRKRAIQFGTRIAQQTNIAVYGSHSKGSGNSLYFPLS